MLAERTRATGLDGRWLCFGVAKGGAEVGGETPENSNKLSFAERNTRFVCTIIQRDAGVAGVAENPYTGRKMRGPRLN